MYESHDHFFYTLLFRFWIRLEVGWGTGEHGPGGAEQGPHFPLLTRLVPLASLRVSSRERSAVESAWKATFVRLRFRFVITLNMSPLRLGRAMCRDLSRSIFFTSPSKAPIVINIWFRTTQWSTPLNVNQAKLAKFTEQSEPQHPHGLPLVLGGARSPETWTNY